MDHSNAERVARSRRLELNRRRVALLSRIEAVEEEDGRGSPRLRSRFHRIEAALERLDAGTYGACLGCGRAVEAEWLDEMPDAERCAACESASMRAGDGRAVPSAES
jgi:hypothetical protein